MYYTSRCECIAENFSWKFLSTLYIKHLKILLVIFHYPVFEKTWVPLAKYLASNRTGSEKWSSLKSLSESFTVLAVGTVLRSSGGILLLGLLTLTNPSTSRLLAAQEKLRLCIDPWRLLQSQIVKCSRKFSRVPPLLPELIHSQTSKKSRNIQNKFNRVLFRIQRVVSTYIRVSTLYGSLKLLFKAILWALNWLSQKYDT